MVNYRHKTLWWIANYFDTSVVWWYKISDENWLLVFGDNRIWEEELAKLWFEEVEEKDWIDEAIDFYWNIAKADDREDTKKYLRIAIEKHAPKQKQINYLELWERYKKTAWWGTVCFADICDLLRDNNLLSPSD